MSSTIDDGFMGVLRAEINAMAGAVDRVSVEEARRVEDTLFSCKGRVLLTGAGTSSILARKIAHTLNCSGTPTFFLDPTMANHGSSGAVTDGDVLILFSKGGETDELITLLAAIEDKDVIRIAATEKPESTMGLKSDFIFHLPSMKEVDPHGVIATTSILFTMAVFDSISMQLMDRGGYTLEDFAKTHPGGAVGKRFADDNV